MFIKLLQCIKQASWPSENGLTPYMFKFDLHAPRLSRIKQLGVKEALKLLQTNSIEIPEVFESTHTYDTVDKGIDCHSGYEHPARFRQTCTGAQKQALECQVSSICSLFQPTPIRIVVRDTRQ